MKKWEYRGVSYQKALIHIGFLDKLGEEGWEVCGFETPTSSLLIHYLLKRPVTKKRPRRVDDDPNTRSQL